MRIIGPFQPIKVGTRSRYQSSSGTSAEKKKKIEEWVAFGGERLLDQGQYLAESKKNNKFKREFYWDLWQDLDNLRAQATAVTTVATYLERAYLESKGIQRERAQSFDTQT